MNQLILYGNYAFCEDRVDADKRDHKLYGGDHSQSELDAFERALSRDVPIPAVVAKTANVRGFAA